VALLVSRVTTLLEGPSLDFNVDSVGVDFVLQNEFASLVQVVLTQAQLCLVSANGQGIFFVAGTLLAGERSLLRLLRIFFEQGGGEVVL